MKSLPLLFASLFFAACTIQAPGSPTDTSAKTPTPSKPDQSRPTGSSAVTVTETNAPTSYPNSVAVQAVLPANATAIHESEDPTVEMVSLLTLDAAPTMIPEPPSAASLDLSGNRLWSVMSPASGSCSPDISVTVNPSTVSVQITGTDYGNAECATWMDQVAKEGVVLQLNGDAEWENTTELVSVSVMIR